MRLKFLKSVATFVFDVFHILQRKLHIWLEYSSNLQPHQHLFTCTFTFLWLQTFLSYRPLLGSYRWSCRYRFPAHTLACPTRHLGQQQPVLPSHKQVSETAPCFPNTIFPLDDISCETKHQLLGLLLRRWGKGWPPGTEDHLWPQHMPPNHHPTLPSHLLVRKQFGHLNISSQWHCRCCFWSETFKW